MPVISTIQDYDGFGTKVERLGLAEIVAEVNYAVVDFDLLIEERKEANGTRDLRRWIDDGFTRFEGWKKTTVGTVDWVKVNEKGGSVGVEVQVSGRSDMLSVDVLHLRQKLIEGEIDVGIIVVPEDRLSKFLTDRTPNLRTAKKHVESRAADMPIRIIAFEHDGVGPALDKMVTNLGKRR